MKYIIIIYFIVVTAMILMIPVKLLTSRQTRCPACGGSVLVSKRGKISSCPHCGGRLI
ncbi:hypothetical protein DCCM_4123 [Desulfocucumis palustris]|uniref:Uncharacterized protein n=1 Tax=Desulfocucumis palustris TaxID=1898651 RepID=A0A2L2XFU6_9FIRM|nr:hypothetical protein [Desulfocucumis palustris]GBF35002.1 hypothetical protein DCCM_4123 [Desulfocucumis palustris]